MLGDKQAAASLVGTDLERAKKFYTEKLGLSVVEEMPGGILFGAGGGTTIFMYEREGGSKAEHTVVGFSIGDVEAEVAALRANGVEFEEYDLPDLKTVNGVASHGEWKAAWLRDPEGNIIALTQM